METLGYLIGLAYVGLIVWFWYLYRQSTKIQTTKTDLTVINTLRADYGAEESDIETIIAESRSIKDIVEKNPIPEEFDLQPKNVAVIKPKKKKRKTVSKTKKTK